MLDQTMPMSLCENSQNHFDLLNAPKGKLLWIDAILKNTNFGDMDALVSRRLMDFGMLPNTAIQVVTKSPFGRAPIVVQIANGSQFILRKDEAKKIQCRFA